MKYLENNKFDYFIKLALLDCGKKDVKMFDEIDDSQIVLSERLNRKIKKLISQKAREQSFANTKRVFVRIAIVAMLIMSLMFAALISVTAIREAIWKAIVEWHENYIVVRYESSNDKEYDKTPQEDIADNVNNNDVTNNDVNENTSFENVEIPSVEQPVVTPPTKIEEVRKPTYIMDGVVEDIFQNKSQTVVDYYLEDVWLYSFTQRVLKDNNSYVDNEGAKIEEVNINSYTAKLITYLEKAEILLIWHDNEYMYVLRTNTIDATQLIEIALSIK